MSRLRIDFRGEMKRKNVHILDIPDEYQYMDSELIDLMIDAVTPIVDAAMSGD